MRDLLPNESISYLGDTARVPYGPKSPETVQRYAIELAEMLIKQNAKALIVACNTVSSVALPALTKKFRVPVIGVIEPGARAALAVSRNYEKALRAADGNVRVSSRACPLLVPLIEEGLLNDDVTDRMILRYLEPLLADDIDTLVLGCTHYPLLTAAIARVLKRQIMIVDSAQNCARAVEEMLDRESLHAAPLNQGKLQVALTDAADNFLNVARDALQLKIGEVQLHPLT
jgi:glutamate racemase